MNFKLLDKLIINDPIEFHDRTFLSHLYQLPLDDESYTNQLENVMTTGKYMLFCQIYNVNVTVLKEIINYPIYAKKLKEVEKTCPYHTYLELLSNKAAATNFKVTDRILKFTVIVLALKKLFAFI